MNTYLRKYALRPELIAEWPQPDLGIVVVIPASDEPHIHHCIHSLYNCIRPPCSVEVLVVINASEMAPAEVHRQNERTAQDCEQWLAMTNDKQFRVYSYLENDIPAKHAGVGMARKMGMDEATRRFDKVGNDAGIIACFDADSTCDPNYLVELYAHFRLHPLTPACSIAFAHPTFGAEYEPYVYLGITYYELHLRYYNQALRSTGFPYAFHTIGSAMAVRTSAYKKQGGMNRRQAGEDFYFLHKLMDLGHYTELNSTCIFPSPRPSTRVPFGTGKAVKAFIDDPQKGFYTYNLQSFKYLQEFFKNLPEFYLAGCRLEHLGDSLPYVLIDFLDAYFFDERIEEIRANSAGYNSFRKRFYKWFNALMVLKFVHFVRDNAHPNVRVEHGAMDFLRSIAYPHIRTIGTLEELLQVYRALDASVVPAQLHFK